MFTTYLSRLLLLSWFGLMLMLTSSVCLAVSATQSVEKIPIIHVAAKDLTPLDRGLSIGQQSKQLFPDIEHRYDLYLSESFSQMGFNDLLRVRLPSLKNTLDNKYQKELEGVASAWTLVHENKLGDGFLSWDEYWLLNLLPDMGMPVNGVGFGILSLLSTEQGSIVGRNLNLKSTPELRSLQAITVYHYAGHAVVNIGFAGIVSVLTGYNESGLFVAHFNASADTDYQNPYALKSSLETSSGSSIQAKGFVLRKALETRTTTKKAGRFIAKNSSGLSHNTLIADKKNILVVEYMPDRKAKIRYWNSQTRPNKSWQRPSQIAVVDCHVLKELPDNCQRAKDGYRWEKLRTSAVFNKTKKAGVQDVASVMLDKSHQYYEILGTDTLQSMIYLPGSGHLYLYAAAINSNNDTTMPVSYQVYSQDIIPVDVRKLHQQSYFFWLFAGLLSVLMLILWLIRRSMKKGELSRVE